MIHRVRVQFNVFCDVNHLWNMNSKIAMAEIVTASLLKRTQRMHRNEHKNYASAKVST